jgi:uncharacterized protein (TIGR01777 family)
MAKKIIITGATGLIGSRLTSELVLRKYEVTVFTRNAQKAKKIVFSSVNYVEWDYHQPDKWYNELESSFAIVHLAGVSIAGGRFTESYKKKVFESRVTSTQNIVKVISETKNKPSVFLCASGINYYGESGDKILVEDSTPGIDFLADVCEKWENEASKVEDFGVRRVSLRTSPVLSTRDGMLKTLLPLFRFYLGASLGSGKQWFSWIHIDDIIKAYIYALEDVNLHGPINASSPDPVRMDEFAEQFGRVIHRPVFFKVPKFALRIVKGEAADYITASMRVVPRKLQDYNFTFSYPQLGPALQDLIQYKK